MTRVMNSENLVLAVKGTIVCFFMSIILGIEITWNDVRDHAINLVWLGVVAVFTGILTVIGKYIGERVIKWYRGYVQKEKDQKNTPP